MEVDIPRLLFQHSIKEHLYRNGFKWIDRFCISSKNTPYYIHEGETYVMTEWIDGRECDFYNLQDIKKAMSTLVEMHIRSNGMTPMEGSRIQYDKRDFSQIFQKRIREFNTIKRKINRQSHMSDFDILFLKHYRYYEALCFKSLEWIEEAHYHKILNKVQEEKSFYHNDYTYHNLFMIPDGSLYVTHFEESKYGIPLYDLVSLLKKVMKKQEWNIQIAHQLLSIYNQKIDLQDQKNLLISLLIYPDDFLKVCNKYYNTRRIWASQGLLRKLNFIIDQKQDLQEFIKYVENL